MGFLRLFLALSVVSGHAQSTVFGFRGVDAFYAVNVFFVISGLYMAMVLNEKYKNTDTIKFYKSRALRLFPVYWVGLLLGFAVNFNETLLFFENLSLGPKLFYVFTNLFIFGQDLSYQLCVPTIASGCAHPLALTINPPTWSLALELGFYSIAPFVLKSEKKTFLYALLGSLYFLILNKIHFPTVDEPLIRSADFNLLAYHFYGSSFIFFGVGALSYHCGKARIDLNGSIYIVALMLIGLLSFAKTIIPTWQLFLVFLSVPILFKYTANNHLDRTIGELSYPIYILHFPVLQFFKSHADLLLLNFVSLGTAVAVCSGVMGLLLYYFLEKRINIYHYSYGGIPNNTVPEKSIGPNLYIFSYLILPFIFLMYILMQQFFGMS